MKISFWMMMVVHMVTTSRGEKTGDNALSGMLEALALTLTSSLNETRAEMFQFKSTLEAKMEALGTRVNSIQSTVSSLSGRMSSAESRIVSCKVGTENLRDIASGEVMKRTVHFSGLKSEPNVVVAINEMDC